MLHNVKGPPALPEADPPQAVLEREGHTYWGAPVNPPCAAPPNLGGLRVGAWPPTPPKCPAPRAERMETMLSGTG